MGRWVLGFILWIEAHKKLAVLLTLVSLILIVYPRFNGEDISLIRPIVGSTPADIVDIHNYVQFSNFFKDQVPLDSVLAPYSYRPLVPFVASLLPSTSLKSISQVNVFALLISVICIYFILKRHGFRFGLRILGCLLYIFSFPVFYYGSAGYIDATALSIIALIVVATVYDQYLLLPVLFVAAAFAKEVTIVSLPFVALWMYLGNESKQRKRKALTILFLSLVLFVVTILYSRATFGIEKGYLWIPALSHLKDNVLRLKSYFSFVLSFGVVGILGIAAFMKDYRNSRSEKSLFYYLKAYRFTPHIASIAAASALSAYAFVAAYADGRYFWTAYPFLIPLAVRYLDVLTINAKEKPLHAPR